MIVTREDLQAGAGGKSDERHIRILESDAIDVVTARAINDLAHFCIAGDEPVENRRVDLPRDGHALPRRSPAGRLRRWLDVPPNEPSPEPTWCDLVDRAGLGTT